MIDNSRIQILLLKYLLEQDKGDRTEDEIMSSLTSDDFERAFIPLACHWENDIFDICIYSLGIIIPFKFKSINIDNLNDYNIWLEATVNKLWEYVQPARIFNDQTKTWYDPREKTTVGL